MGWGGWGCCGEGERRVWLLSRSAWESSGQGEAEDESDYLPPIELVVEVVILRPIYGLDKILNLYSWLVIWRLPSSSALRISSERSRTRHRFLTPNPTARSSLTAKRSIVGRVGGATTEIRQSKQANKQAREVVSFLMITGVVEVEESLDVDVELELASRWKSKREFQLVGR